MSLEPEGAGRLRTLVLVGALLAVAGPALAQAAGGDKPESIDWLELAMGFLGGLALFLFAVRELAHRLSEVASDRFKSILRKGSGDRIRGLLSGTGATMVLDSSSATIILVIALVHAGLISFVAALPVILGSNIGTTLSSQIFASNLDKYSPIMLAVGLLWSVLAKSDRAKAWGGVLFGLGLVLFSLSIIGDAVEPLEDQPAVIDFLRRFEAPIIGLLAGAAVTVALQSSSAVIGIVIVLAGQGIVSLEAGLALMLGAEIGTCADTLVATIGRSAAAIRAGVFHLVFNILSAAVGVALIGQLNAFAQWSSDDVGKQIANAHVLFNVVGALVVLPFVPWAATALKRLIPGPDQAEDEAEPAAAPA